MRNPAIVALAALFSGGLVFLGSKACSSGWLIASLSAVLAANLVLLASIGTLIRRTRLSDAALSKSVRLAVAAGIFDESAIATYLGHEKRSLAASILMTEIRISLPPGSRLAEFAEFFYSKKTYQGVFEPTLKDLQEEYNDALNEGRKWKARWVWIRGCCSFWLAALAQAPLSLIKVMVQLWKAAS